MVEARVPAAIPTDLQDERLRGPSGMVGGFINRIRGGDLGLLPVVLGLIVISAVFQLQNSIFLSERNLVNLLMEAAPVGMIALGIVCVLLVGEIDLSVGSVSGVSAAITAILAVNHGLPVWLAVAAAIGAGAAIGFVYAQVFSYVGVPSFVITVAGLLAFLGLQLRLFGQTQAINLGFSSGLVKFGQGWFIPAWLSYALVAVGAGGLLVVGLVSARSRRAAGLSAPPMPFLVIRSVLIAGALELAVYYLNRDRGVGWMFAMFVGLAMVLHYSLTRTKWGRSMFAVGGNEEAARRAGINVHMIYTSAFMLCAGLAAVGGILAAARLGSAGKQTGTGDVNLNAIAAAVIGGTSLFGGRGSAYSAVLGILVIQAISSGLNLLNLDSAYRNLITGAVLLLAVCVDSIARRSRSAHGRD